MKKLIICCVVGFVFLTGCSTSVRARLEIYKECQGDVVCVNYAENGFSMTKDRNFCTELNMLYQEFKLGIMPTDECLKLLK